MKREPKPTLRRLMFANPVSAVYLGVVGAAIGVATIQPLFAEHGMESLIWVWPALLTFPTFSLVALAGDALFGPETATWYLIGGVVVSALVQSLVLGVVWEALRRPRRRLNPSRG
jgi:cell shape-determining protein MreD